jgi:hypothetical protein
MNLICNHCHQEKDEEEFNWRWKSLNTRQRTCRECQKAQKNDWYSNNADRHKANIYQNKLSNVNDAREYVRDYLSNHHCVDCGEADIRVLEFDHVRGQKRETVGILINRGYPLSTIIEEISKCEVVCSNCHKKRTYRGSWRDR